MITTAIERVRSAVTAQKRDTTVTLEAALAELRKIENRRAEMVAFDNAHCQELQRQLTECEKAGAAYQSAVRGENIEKIRETLPKWVSLPPQSELLRVELGRVSREQAIDQGRVGKLKAEFPQMQNVLLGACRARLTEANAELERLHAVEQARLDRDYANAGYNADDSQPVKRERSRVNWLAQIEKRITTEGVETTWLPFAKELLRG